MIIDIHTHVFPDQLAPRAIAVLTHNCDTQPYLDGTCTMLCDSMLRAGIDRSVIMPIATKPEQVRSINLWAADARKQYERIICFGTLHPLQSDLHAEVDRLVANGIPGVKLHPDYQDFFVDDPALIPLYNAMANAGLILLLHAGVDIGLAPPVHCTPERLARVLDAVPTLTVIAAHMGGYACWDDVQQYLVGRKLYFDTSYSLMDLGTERMVELIRSHGANQILFGTDSPWTDQATEVPKIQALPLTNDEINAILGDNALRLLQGRV